MFTSKYAGTQDSTEDRSSPTTFPDTLTLLNTTACYGRLSYISISSQAAYEMLFLHHFFFFFLSSLEKFSWGWKTIPSAFVCNFKMNVFAVISKCQAALRETGESSAQQKTSNKRL